MVDRRERQRGPSASAGAAEAAGVEGGEAGSADVPGGARDAPGEDVPIPPSHGRGFGVAVRALRRRSGISLNELARRAEIDPAYVHRIERGAQVVPRRAIVLRLATALRLNREELDDLLARGEYCPETVQEIGGWDSALASVASVLADGGVTGEAKAEFREVLRLLVRRWQAFPASRSGS